MRIYGWTFEYMDERMDSPDRQSYRQTDKHKYGWIDAKAGRQMDRQSQMFVLLKSSFFSPGKAAFHVY